MNVLSTVIGVLIAIVIGSLLIAFPVMWLWNYVMPDLFGLIKIGFWQALALSVLCGFLFKSNDYSKD